MQLQSAQSSIALAQRKEHHTNNDALACSSLKSYQDVDVLDPGDMQVEALTPKAAQECSTPPGHCLDAQDPEEAHSSRETSF